MKLRPSTLLLAMQLLAMLGCSSIDAYKGDGKLEDQGPLRLKTERYVVTLGAVDFGKAGQTRFRSSGLPATEFTLGLRATKCVCPIMNSDAHVTLEIKNERGETVIDQNRRLRDLTWATDLAFPCDRPALGYVRSTSKKSYANGLWSNEAIFEGADGGSGSSFKARKSGTYDTVITVHSSAGQGCDVQAVLLGA